MVSDGRAEMLNRGLAAVEAFAAGTRPDAAAAREAVAALTFVLEQHDLAGPSEEGAQCASLLAAMLRIEADLQATKTRGAAMRAAHAAATAAQDRAIRIATTAGVNDANLAAYVRATNEAALSALALGEADATPAGTALLAEAADFFGEAEAGYRRLGRNTEAQTAALKAVEARARRALRD